MSTFLKIRTDMLCRTLCAAAAAGAFVVASGVACAQAPPATMPAGSTPPAAAGAGAPSATEADAPPADYIIGIDDILTVNYWRDESMSSDVVVRPDGMITLPLLNDIRAAGLTPEQLRQVVTDEASKFVEGPTVNVIVKQINSRKVFVTGEVLKPGTYPLGAGMTVLQMIALAGGVSEYADKGNIGIFRTENGRQVRYRFNYNQVMDGRNLQQNIELKPNDTIVVRD